MEYGCTLMLAGWEVFVFDSTTGKLTARTALLADVLGPTGAPTRMLSAFLQAVSHAASCADHVAAAGATMISCMMQRPPLLQSACHAC